MQVFSTEDIIFSYIAQNPATSDGVFNVVGTIGLTTKVAARALISLWLTGVLPPAFRL